MKIRHVMAVIMMGVITGCSVLQPIKTQPINYYMINTLPNNPKVQAKHQGILMVATPSTRPIYHTTRMAYSTERHKIAYFGQNEWAEPPATMLQPLIIETLQRTRRFQSIVTTPYSGPYDYLLSTELLQFETDYTIRPAIFKLTANMTLSHSRENKPLMTRQFKIDVPLVKPTPYAGVLAANEATKRLLSKIASVSVESV